MLENKFLMKLKNIRKKINNEKTFRDRGSAFVVEWERIYCCVYKIIIGSIVEIV